MTEKRILPMIPLQWFIIGIVVMLLSSMFFMGYNYESAGASSYNRGTSNLKAMYDDGILLGILMVVGLIPALTPLGRKIGPDKYALMYTFWHLGYSMAWMGRGLGQWALLWRRYPLETWAKLVPSYFSFPLPYANNFATSGAVDWAAITPALAWWTFLTMVMAFMQYFMGVIWRRQLIEVDKLPFPVQIPTIEVIKQITTSVSEKSGRGGILKSKVLWIGFVLAWLIFGWDIVHILSRGAVPTLAKPVVGIRWWAKIYADLYPYLHVHFLVTADILDIVLFLGILPMDILTTMVIWSVFWYDIWFNIATAVGYYPSTGWGGGPIDSDWISATVNVTQPFPQLRFIDTGVLMGIAIFFIWHSRGHLKNVLGALRGRRDLDDPGLSYRIAVPGFIGCIVVLLAMAVGSGAYPEFILLMIAFNFIFALGMMRMRGEVWEGANGYIFSNYFDRSTLPLLPRDASIRQSSAAVTTAVFGHFTSSDNDQYRDFMLKVPDSLKVSREVGGIDRQIIMAIIIGTIIGLPFAAFFRTWLGFSGNWYAATPGGGWVADGYYKGTNYGITSMQSQIYLGGALFGIVLMLLRTRFAWFPLNPVAIAAWDIMGMYGDIYMFEMLIVFVARLLIWRLGGAKVQRIVTLGCIGFLGGFYFKELLNWVIGRFIIGVPNIPPP